MKFLSNTKLLLAVLLLLTTVASNSQKTILDVSFDENYMTSQGWGVWDYLTEDKLPVGFGFIMPTSLTESIVTPLQVATGWVLWLGGNAQYKDGDAWLTYTLSNLTIGARYEISADIGTAQGWGGIGYTLAMWDANEQPQQGLASSACLQCNIAGNTSDLNLSTTITATSRNMTFGIGMGKDGVYYQRTIIKNWKISEISPEEYTINYHNLGRKNYEDNPSSYNIGTPDITLEAPYDSLGYLFAGWFTDATFTQSIPTPAIPKGSTGEIDFYAKWDVASLAGEIGISGIVKSGRELSAFVDEITNNTGTLSYQWQSGDGATFTDINGATASTFLLTDTEVGKNIRLVVKSSEQSGSLIYTSVQTVLATNVSTYVITYNANGGLDGFITSEEIAQGTNAAATANPSREGYELSGWNTKADGSGSAFTNLSAVTGNITVYAQWDIVTYSVTFDNDGFYAVKTTTIENEGKIELPSAPSKEGHTFNGWNTQADGRGTNINANSTITNDIKVYAQWALIQYTVTFDDDGVYASVETSIDQQYRITLPDPPEKEGFTFKNWNTKADGLGTIVTSETIINGNTTAYAQWREIIHAIPISVNLNMKHSVDGVSDFGRERHIISHTGLTDPDWEGHEDMMDYFFNDLDVYMGRDNGSAGWKNKMVKEDPAKPHWPDPASIKTVGDGLRNWYESSDHIERHQYENRLGSMIMGMNPHPVYPSMDWADHGKMTSGWQTYDVDAAAYFVAEYLDKNYAKTSDEIGEQLPVYWECMNEPDMAVMNPSAMFLSSFEKIFEFHNLSALEIRKALGVYAPKIGGFTWGQHDFWGSDFINRWPNAETTYYQYSDHAIYPAYDNMWLGNDGKGTRAEGSTLYQTRKSDWWQWDALYQEFMETCGENMDFYSLHFYDWPLENDGGVIRCGGPVEASLDMLESFEIDRFGSRKEAIVSEFGSVSPLVTGLPYKRRDWENLRPFNQMFMQFLERPSHLRLTMPFAPIKAIWGDWWNEDGSLARRYPSTMMDPVGEYKAPGNNHKAWEWSGMILWYELWKDVKGTRIDTKSDNPDIQVDAYVDGTHVYLILNNLELANEYLYLNLFDDYDNQVKGVKMTHQYLDEDLNRPVNDVKTMAAIPAQVKLKKSATMILDIEYEYDVAIDQESKETKYISERLTSEKNRFGRDKYYVQSHPAGTDFIAHVNNVVVPSEGEANVRIGMRIWNGVRLNVWVNGTAVQTSTHQGSEINVKGRQESRGGSGYYGVVEINVPLEVLKANNEIKIQSLNSNMDISSIQIQVWDMTTKPGRAENESQLILPSELRLIGEENIMEGTNIALQALFTPANATNKALEWSSSNPSLISVDDYGVVSANAASGNVVITATSLADGSVFAEKTLNAIAFQNVPVTGIEILEGERIDAPYYINTSLTAKVYPENATNQAITWTSSNDQYVYVNAKNGRITGKAMDKTAYVIATISDEEKNYSDSIRVTVKDVVNSTGENKAGDDLSKSYLYPNPARNIAYVHGGNFSTARVYSMTGSLVLTGNLKNNTIVISSLNDGIYVVELASKNQKRKTEKLVIQR